MIKINGVTIKEPTNLKVSRYNLTKNGRVSSGKMTMELVAKKRKLFLTYDSISGKDMKQILDLIDGTKMFFDVTWDEYDGTKTAKMYVGEIPLEYFRKNLGWYWKNVTFDLIEQ